MSGRNIVIVGGGFAGIQLAVSLEKRLPPEHNICVVSRDNFITYNPLLPEVVGASLLPGHVVAPLRQMLRRTKTCMVTVTDINTTNKTIEYLGEGAGQIQYDDLALAFGTDANLSLVKGMNRHALPLKTLGDALFLRNHIIVRLEQAELQRDPITRRWLTTFTVIGGGFSGVEVAGELIDFLHASLKYYPGVTSEDIRVVLLHSGDRLLPELSAALGRFALTKMQRNGIEIRLQSRASRIDDHGLELSDASYIAAGTIISTIGTKPNGLIANMNLPLMRGRVATDGDMSVPGIDGLWAIGDCAAVPNAHDGSVSPPTAQFADRQAKQLAKNIVARCSHKPTKPFRYKALGQFSSIGHNRAVAEIFGLKIGGFVAWLLWRGVYLLKMPTFARKARLFLEWNWAMFFPPDIAHLGFRRTRRGDKQSSTKTRLDAA